MHRQRILLAVALAASILSIFAMTPPNGATSQAVTAAAASAKPSGGSTSYQEPVTSLVFDYDLTGTLLLMRSDDYNGGVGQATYTTFSGKGANSASVISEINTNGTWYLSMNNQSGRTLWLTPNQAINSSQPAAPPAGYYDIQKAYSPCVDQSGNIVPFENLLNGSGNCAMAVNFISGGILYKLMMKPASLSLEQGVLCPSGGCPATGLAQVTCNAASGNACVNWTITPNAAAPLVGVSNLYSYTGPRGTPWVFIGQYYNTFRINASHP